MEGVCSTQRLALSVLSYNGGTYEGELKGGKPHGGGVCRYANGDVYDGEWKEGARHGRGTYTWTGGDVYRGEFVDGKQQGKGTMKSASGRIYEGLWMNGLRVCNQGRTMRSELSQQRRLQAATKNCEHCGVNEGQYKLRVCSGCNLALYCSTACQKAASRSHRRICDMVSILPSRDSDKITLEYDRENMVDLDAGLRYATKYMNNLRHVKINLKKMKRGQRAPNFTAERLSSLLKSKKKKLDSVLWLSNEYISDPPASRWMWMDLQGLKQLWIEHAIFDDVQPIHDIILQQRNTLMVLCLPWLRIDWNRAKCRRSLAQAVSSCKQLVKLDLNGSVLVDSDLKIMLQDLPNLRILYLTRGTNHIQEFTDNTCGLIARKCPGLLELSVYNHFQLSVKGVRKIFEGCPHFRSFSSSARKLSCKDVRNLLDIAPQLMYFSVGEIHGLSNGSDEEMAEIVEEIGGRTVFQLIWDDGIFDPSGISAKTREKYEHQKGLLDEVLSRQLDPAVANEWEELFEGDESHSEK